MLKRGAELLFKLIDLGLSSDNHDAAVENGSCGTRTFWAPELFREEQYNTTETDMCVGAEGSPPSYSTAS